MGYALALRVQINDDFLVSSSQPPSGPPHPAEIVNRTFYASPPHTYFRRRLLLLLTMADRRDDLVRFWAEGVSFGDVKRQYQALDDEADAEDATAFVAAESQVLAHHLFETLLRVFMAHMGDRSCPPMEVATLVSYAEFKRRLKAQFLPEDASDPGLIKEIAEVICGIDGEGLPEDRRARYERDAREIERFLRRFAHMYLDDAHLYNRAKHGFVVASGEHGFSISDDGSRAQVRLGGNVLGVTNSGRIPLQPDVPATNHLAPAVAFISRDEQTRRWCLKVQWPRVERTLLYCCLAVDWLDSIWQIGRARRLDVPARPQPFLNLRFDDIENGFPEPTWALSIDLAEESPPAKSKKRRR